MFVDLLDANVRTAFPSGDMQQLGPALQRARGSEYVRQRLVELLPRAANQRERKALEEMKSRY